ncbi:MAG: (Fe-S)-binding protein [archaeon]|nr:(Fe-S)-binding protein [archaeon]
MIKKIKKYKWMVDLAGNTTWEEKKRIVGSWTKGKQYYEVENSQTNMKEVLKCALCPNMCRFECPTLRVTQKETYSPAAKIRIMYYWERGNIIKNKAEVLKSTAEVAYLCVNCNGCQAWCPMDISAGDLLKGVRADLVKHEIYIPEIKEFNDRLEENKTAFKKDTFSSDNSFNVVMENPEIFYYIGCVMAEKKPEAVKANIEILKMAGVRFSTLTNERQCCGGPLNTLGFTDTVKKFAENNIQLFEKAGAPVIISDCPACATTIEQTYIELGFKHKYQVLTTTQYFKKLINERKISPTESVDLTITYHDPCYTARGLEKQESLLNDPTNINKSKYNNSAREIFSEIPGLILKETFLHGKETQCCGRGGVCHVHHPEISDMIGKQRVEQLKETGADIICSSCPSCEEGLIDNGGGNVLDIGEILLKSLKTH